MFYVYKITNLINGKIYIGKTNSLPQRLKDHIKVALGGPQKYKGFSAIHKAISKYGKENFSIEKISEHEFEEDALSQEIYWIDKLNTRKLGYNCTLGGEGISGYVFSDEIKKKISQSHMGKILSDEHKENISKGFDQNDRIKQSERFRGEKSNNVKLNEEQVKEIKRLLAQGLSNRKIAPMFGVGKSIIGDIGRGRCWSHIKI